ncbi:hypothetical protein ACN1C3_12025 [Pseudomonas sp. H11T01]|uniref:hypothetical protein n=1 Tax=Pseudomonas sp. H11T01 TaxID=3402749 RepID=UPI003ABF439B
MSNPEFKVDLAQNRSGAELTKGRVCRAVHANAARFKPGTLALGNEPQASGYGGSGLMSWLYASEDGYSRNKEQPALLIERIGAFPSSGEIRRKVEDPLAVLERIKRLHAALALVVDEAEGLSLVLADWRFKLRISTIEPVIFLRVESRGDVALMQAKTAELLEQIGGKGADCVQP